MRQHRVQIELSHACSSPTEAKPGSHRTYAEPHLAKAVVRLQTQSLSEPKRYLVFSNFYVPWLHKRCRLLSPTQLCAQRSSKILPAGPGFASPPILTIRSNVGPPGDDFRIASVPQRTPARAPP